MADKDFLEILLNRRSVRRYTGESLPDEALKKILRAGLLSPTGRNTRSWEFVVLQEPEKLKQLSGCRDGAANMLEKAGCAVLVFGDSRKTDTWEEDCSIAMSNMHLMAESLGFGSCWIQGRLRKTADGRTTEEFCRELCSVPEFYRLEAVLSIGVTEQHPEPHRLEEADMSKVHYEKF